MKTGTSLSQDHNEFALKRRRLVDAKKNHMETVTFLGGLPTKNESTQLAYEKALAAVMETNEEIVRLDASISGTPSIAETNEN
jgi:hypothetical protein